MSAVRPAGALSRLLSPGRIIIWDDPVAKEDVRRQLVNSIIATEPALNTATIIQKLAEREALGSTYLNEGIALPHARREGLQTPQIALGLTRAGLLDVATQRPIEAVFLLLSPMTGSNIHLQLLAKAGRALQSRELRTILNRASSPAEALDAIQDFEAASSGQTATTPR
jgi:mannitol/fructose-specific phosphotransferase system IIA component (Ntr-type)